MEGNLDREKKQKKQKKPCPLGTPWRRQWQPTLVFLPGESKGWGSLVSCCLWGCTESDTTEATWQQQALGTP